MIPATLGTVRRTVTLEIAGNPYRMASDAEQSHLDKLTALINERVNALGPKAKTVSNPAHLLAVIALGLADELVLLEERSDAIEQRSRAILTRSIATIDQVLESSDL